MTLARLLTIAFRRSEMDLGKSTFVQSGQTTTIFHIFSSQVSVLTGRWSSQFCHGVKNALRIVGFVIKGETWHSDARGTWHRSLRENSVERGETIRKPFRQKDQTFSQSILFTTKGKSDLSGYQIRSDLFSCGIEKLKLHQALL